MTQRTAFFISDRTGITASALGNGLLSQFESVHFKQHTLPFVDTIEKANMAVNQINAIKELDGCSPIIFCTVINDEVRTIIQQSQGFVLDFFHTFIGPLEQELGVKSTHAVGKTHSILDADRYNLRMDSVNFALQYDDGSSTRGYDMADVILVGVSRCGKTPTSLYLAMQFGIRAANYPLTEEDLEYAHLPKVLKPFKDKLFGLTIDPRRLSEVRQERLPNSRYAELKQCQKEVQTVEAIFDQNQIPYLNSTTCSIEEMATKLMVLTKLERRIY